MLNLTSYLDSYDKMTPSGGRFVRMAGRHDAGLDATRHSFSWAKENTERVTADNYPKLHQALAEECEFRNVPMPACYIDKSGYCRLGRAFPQIHSILVQPEAYDIMTKDELRALCAHELKHLYQGRITKANSHEAEFDADRAAVTSVGIEVIRSYVQKGASLMIEQKVPVKIFRDFLQKVNSTFPSLAQSFPFELDEYHPSPASRMKAMEAENSKNFTERLEQEPGFQIRAAFLR